MNIRLHNLLEEFIIQGGFNIAMLEDDVAYDVDIVNYNFAEDGEYYGELVCLSILFFRV